MLGNSTLVIYYGMKIFLFLSLLGALMKSELMREQTLGLSVIYSFGVGFLSYIFLVGPNADAATPEDWQNWGIWLGATFVLSWLYFKSLTWCEESKLFWVVVALGAAVVWF